MWSQPKVDLAAQNTICSFGLSLKIWALSGGVALCELLSLSMGLVDVCGRWRGGLWRLLCGVCIEEEKRGPL